MNLKDEIVLNHILVTDAMLEAGCNVLSAVTDDEMDGTHHAYFDIARRVYRVMADIDPGRKLRPS